MRKVQEIELPLLVDGLRAVRKSSFTNLAKSLEIAATLRRSSSKRRSYNDHEWNMQLGRGYTRAQQVQGSFKSALKRNREALKRHFAACVPVMQEKAWHGLLNQTIDAITVYGIDRRELEAMLVQPLRDEHGMLPNDAADWADYCSMSNKQLERVCPLV
jgi:hypothetical protein